MYINTLYCQTTTEEWSAIGFFSTCLPWFTPHIFLLGQHAITNINRNLTAVMKGNSSAKEMHNAHMVLDECGRERKSQCFCPIDRKNRALSEHFRAQSHHILFGHKPTSPCLFSSFSSLSPPQARIQNIKHSFYWTYHVDSDGEILTVQLKFVSHGLML